VVEANVLRKLATTHIESPTSLIRSLAASADRPRTRPEKGSTGSMYRFQLYRDTASEYRWRLLAPNGRIIADSGEGYVDRGGAKRAAENVRQRIGAAVVEDA
jgi:uncharacterized protein